MSRTYLLGSVAALVVVLVWSAAWSLGATRLNESDLQSVWGGDPPMTTNKALINNQCIGMDTCNCEADPCQLYITDPYPPWCQQTIINNQTFNNCLTNGQSNGKYCYTSYPSPLPYCGTIQTSVPLDDGTCPWTFPPNTPVCGKIGSDSQNCGQAVPNGFNPGQTCN